MTKTDFNYNFCLGLNGKLKNIFDIKRFRCLFKLFQSLEIAEVT